MDNFINDPVYAPFKDYTDAGELELKGRSITKTEHGWMISNSEKEFRCWFIENPSSKDLVKSVKVKIEPNTE